MDTVTAVENAQSRGNFSVLAFIEQTAYPTSEVTLFQDVKSADEYVKSVNKRFELEKAKEDTTELDAQIEALGQKVSDSALIFELRGMPPGVSQRITSPEGSTDNDSDAIVRARDNELIAKTIVRVKNAKGEYDEHLWEAEDVNKLREFLKEGEFGKLVNGVVKVNFNAAIFDEATDAGFSVPSPDVAA